MLKKSLISLVSALLIISNLIGQYKQVNDENFHYRANGAIQFKMVEIKLLSSDTPSLGNEMIFRDGFKLSNNKFRFYKADVRKPDDKVSYNVVILKPASFKDVQKIGKEKDTLTGSAIFINTNDKKKLFWMKEEDFNRYIDSDLIIKRYSRMPVISYGANLSLPFKMRKKISVYDEAIGKDSTFHMKITPEFNLGGYIGLRWRISRYRNAFSHFP